jgi:pentatricopeptide repeat protein
MSTVLGLDDTPLATDRAALPSMSLGAFRVSRLIIGGNPFSGNSHTSAELDSQMLDYFTTNRIKQTLFDCERHGITATLSRGDRHIIRTMREYWNDGGKLQWICQIASELADLKGHIRQVANSGAAAIYHHGTRTDNLWHQGRIDEAHDLLKEMRDTGVTVGFGSHIPEVIEYVEERGWDLDFYVCSVYNLNKGIRQSQVTTVVRNEEVFDDKDRERMFLTIRAVPKPCLAIKILAAGRNCATPEQVRATFEYTFNNIKETDGVVVGMFPKNRDQVSENAAIVRDNCAYNQMLS